MGYESTFSISSVVVVVVAEVVVVVVVAVVVVVVFSAKYRQLQIAIAHFDVEKRAPNRPLHPLPLPNCNAHMEKKHISIRGLPFCGGRVAFTNIFLLGLLT